MNICTKTELRKVIKTKFASFDKDKKQVADILILEKLKANLENFSSNWVLQYGELPTVGVYLPTAFEPHILDVLNWGIARIAFPFCKSKADRLMEYCIFKEELDALKTNKYFLQEQNPQFCLPDLILVPGLAFDRRGYRLGHGYGYYDMYLDHHDCISIGLCYSWQMELKLDALRHDKKMKLIMTETELLKLEKCEFI